MYVLDLFCGAGGATRGYQLAGADCVAGVDAVKQPNYCGDFMIEMDAIEYLSRFRHQIPYAFDMVHASPPCQAGCTLTNGTNAAMGWGRSHEQFVPRTRELLDEIGLPYIIEQPTGHKNLIRTDLRLCMDMFPIGEPPWVMRHRDFEMSGIVVSQPKHKRHRGYVRGIRHGVLRDGPYVAAYGSGGGKASVPEMQHALGIDWTSVREELTEAIPPAYTRYIGAAFLASWQTGGVGSCMSLSAILH